MYYNLGNILQELSELQKAKSCYEKLLNLDPTYKKGYSGYGNLLLKITQHSKGLAYIRKGDGVIRFTQKDVKIILMSTKSALLLMYLKLKQVKLIMIFKSSYYRKFKRSYEIFRST